MTELHEYTALELHQLLQRRQVSPVELAQHFLDRIARLDGEIGAFATVTPEAAIARARHVEEHVPTAAPLWGMPLADKDLHRRAGVPARFGSRAFTDFVPDDSDELVLAVDAAGAVSLGKSATPEFGLPSYTEGLAGPPTRNPWDPSLGAGGSSGGAAAAVASGMLPFAPGSDGGGSIRIPAAACGLVGVKPSRGRVPAGSGLASLAGLGVAGPIARNVADAALLLDGMIAPLGYPAAASVRRAGSRRRRPLPRHRHPRRGTLPARGDDGLALGRGLRHRGGRGGALRARSRDRRVRRPRPRRRGDGARARARLSGGVPHHLAGGGGDHPRRRGGRGVPRAAHALAARTGPRRARPPTRRGARLALRIRGARHPAVRAVRRRPDARARPHAAAGRAGTTSRTANGTSPSRCSSRRSRRS